MSENNSRRRFLKQSLLAAGALPLVSAPFAATAQPSQLPKFHIFSKHLQFLNYADAASVAAELGFDGVDWSVRPNGHVLPERVETDLPKAVEALKRAGLSPLLMTTAVGDSTDATDQRLLKTTAALGFRYYRMNWYRYLPNQSMPEALRMYEEKMIGLGKLNKELNLIGCYQNHAGELVGASVWELWQMLKNADLQHTGVQYDIRHATVEGGLSWKNGLRLLRPHIKTIVLKDFRWAKLNGRWAVENTPIGEGMVDFTSYFKLLKQYDLNVPVSVHLEYPLGGAENGATSLSIDKKVVFEAMKRDLRKLKALWEAA
ncbi:sugar phosphate isomerase/epimerase family protein [Spirosoma soli]|uniref:Sugar phosphate isomerase/epimerase family protein n=2 Tax=Spirosoma soli TaxID=1770529 RepID=A0ABW5M8W4_9BACT